MTTELQADALRGQLDASWQVQSLVQVPSTQTELRDWFAREPLTDGAWRLVSCDHQTAGRGRGGAAWLAEPGTAVLVSLGGAIYLGPWLWPRLSLVAGLAVVEVLRALPGLQGATIKLKWPNDVLVQTPAGWRKVAGLLCERVAGPCADPLWLCGVGVDVAGPLAPGLQDIAVPLRDIAAGPLPPRAELTAMIARGIRREVEAFCARAGLLEAAKVEQHLAFVGDLIELDEGPQVGRRWMRLDGIDPSGQLRGQTQAEPGKPAALLVVQPLAITAARDAGWRAR